LDPHRVRVLGQLGCRERAADAGLDNAAWSMIEEEGKDSDESIRGLVNNCDHPGGILSNCIAKTTGEIIRRLTPEKR
jgi:hypothetical protein